MYNAKSFWFYLLLSALGNVEGYGCVSDIRRLLDNGRSENASSNDEAGAQLKHRRFALCDEGMKDKLLGSNVKAKSSGVSRSLQKAHKRCGKPLTRADIWAESAKTVFACHQEDMPDFGIGSIEDGSNALGVRLVLMSFRSKFVDAHKTQHLEHEHVYQVDPSLAKRDFRSDMINRTQPAYKELYY